MPRSLHNLRSTRPARGVTLVELLTVIAVIAILAGILVPNISLVLRKHREVRSLTLFNKITSAFTSYKLDYGHYPLFKEVPMDKKPWQTNPNEIDYAFLVNDNNSFLRQVLMNDKSYQNAAATPGAVNYNPLKRQYLVIDDSFLTHDASPGAPTATNENPVIVDGFGNSQMGMVVHVGNNQEIDKDSFTKAVLDLDELGPLAPKIIRNVQQVMALYSLVRLLDDGDPINSVWVMNFDYASYNK